MYTLCLGWDCYLVIFLNFVTELLPLIVRISIPLNILISKRQNFTNFYAFIDVDKVKVGIGMHDFSIICSRVIPHDDNDWNIYEHLAFLQHEKG